MRIFVRYHVPDEKGETRRERNERFDQDELSPPLIIPPIGAYIWQWYHSLSARLRRVRDGVCEPIPPSEFAAWVSVTQTIIYPWEYNIISAIDDAYCDEMNKELKDYRARQDEAMKEAAKTR